MASRGYTWSGKTDYSLPSDGSFISVLKLWNCETVYLVKLESAKIRLAYSTLHGRRLFCLAIYKLYCRFNPTPHCIKHISQHKTYARSYSRTLILFSSSTISFACCSIIRRKPSASVSVTFLTINIFSSRGSLDYIHILINCTCR
ncbi:uncharacterized protein LOC134192588 isoform X1 [Corticium candelabrum]|uniref:uncharacterized protein LOC134192588 isoform X1 n=1 Tax=Corticium candelabrum TaxID=121492 RepID=UPI002E27406B|nr:uncharacterized protein LOC134192588 isoform X1 [Corticium candelabrum]